MAGIYLLIEGKQKGPYTEEQIRQSLAQGSIPPDLPAWQVGLPEGWVPISSIVESVSQPIAEPKPPLLPSTSAAATSEKVLVATEEGSTRLANEMM